MSPPRPPRPPTHAHTHTNTTQRNKTGKTGSKGFGDPVTFDNAYYTALLAKPWANNAADPMAGMIGLPSDHALPDDAECAPIIAAYAADAGAFFADFAAAYAKMARLGSGIA